MTNLLSSQQINALHKLNVSCKHLLMTLWIYLLLELITVYCLKVGILCSSTQ